MNELGKLVAVRFLDGTIRKGTTADFKPGCGSFHLRSETGAPSRIETRGLKGVFFIKTLQGNPAHRDRKDYGTKTTPERKVWIEFKDGEAMAGWSAAMGGKEGFYLTPTDPDSNLERVFVFRAAVRRLSQGEDAVRAAAGHRAKPTPPGRPSAGPGPAIRP